MSTNTEWRKPMEDYSPNRNYRPENWIGEKIDDYLTACIHGYPAIDIFYTRILMPSSIHNKLNKEELQALALQTMKEAARAMCIDFKKYIEEAIANIYSNRRLLDKLSCINPDILRDEFTRLALHLWFGLHEFNLINDANMYMIDSFGKNYIAVLIVKESVHIN